MSFGGGGGGVPLSLENNLLPHNKALKGNGSAVVRIENINCPNLLKPKQDCKVEIIFKPKEIKKYEIDLDLNFNLKNELTQIKSLKILGEGIHDETLSILSPLKGSFINSVTASSVVVSGTCDVEGSTITVEPTSQKSLCVDGAYTATLDLLSQLDNNITLTVEMDTGHIPVVRSITVIKDTLAPKIAIINPNSGDSITPANQSSYTVSGTCDLDGAMISFSPTSITTTCMSGAFSKNLDLSAQGDGNLTITANIKDPAGNSSSSSVTLIKDTLAPTIAITSPVDGAYVNSSNQSSYAVSGTCDLEGAMVSFNPTTATATCTSGTFSTNLNLSTQPEGNLTITAGIKDSVGNSSSSSVIVIKDITAPKVAIINPNSGDYVTSLNQSSYTVSGTCDLNGAMISFSPTAATTTCMSGAFSKNLDLSAQGDGNLTITANIKDNAGNSSSSSVTTIKDTMAPTIAITSPVDGDYVSSSNQSSYNVSGTCDINGTTISFNPTTATATCTSGTFSTNLNLSTQPEGNLTISASIKDSAGNSSSSSVTVIKDTIAPKIAITTPVVGSYVNSSNQNSYPVSGTCDLDGAMVSFNPTSVTTTCMSGTFSKSLNLSTQAEGNLTITASIKDTAENSSSSSVTIIKDTTGPQVALGQASSNKLDIENPVSFSVTYTDAASVNLTPAKVTLTGDTTDCVVSVLNGTTQTPTLKLSGCSSASGQVTVQVQEGTAQDAIGNLALASNTQSVTVQNGEPFIAVYRISSSYMRLDLPLKSGFNYNFTVDWGDGTPIQTVTSENDPDKKHAYATTGDYTVTIRGLMEAYGSKSISNSYKTQILSVPNLGDVGWKDLSSAFSDAYILTTVKGGNTSKVTNMARMFDGADNAKPDTSSWDTSNVTDMSAMFYSAYQANPDVSSWDTSNVTNMGKMFMMSSRANPDVSNWDTSNVTNMTYMFSRTDQADPNVSGWDTSRVTVMVGMFYDAKEANPDVSNWDTSNVTDMSSMFSAAIQADPDVSKWDTSNVTNMSSMFSAAIQADPDVSKWDTSNVRYMGQMFRGAVQANPDVSNWDTSRVTRMGRMFSGATRANPDISEWILASIGESFYPLPDIYAFFDSTTYSNLTTTNYSNFLIKLANYEVTSSCEPANYIPCVINVGNVKYNNSAQSARTTLINGGWTIEDGGQQ